MIPIFAQITPTLPTQVHQLQQEFVIEGGTLTESNLFHSFFRTNKTKLITL